MGILESSEINKRKGIVKKIWSSEAGECLAEALKGA